MFFALSFLPVTCHKLEFTSSSHCQRSCIIGLQTLYCVVLSSSVSRFLSCVCEDSVKWGWLAYTTPTVRDILTFAVLRSVTRPFLSLYLSCVHEGHFMFCNKEEFQVELSRKIMLLQFFIGHGLLAFYIVRRNSSPYKALWNLDETHFQ